MSQNFFSLMIDNVKELERKFLITEDASVTYSDLIRLSSIYANILKIKGLKKGDVVVSVTDKSIYSLILYFACLRSGLVFLPINLSYKRQEIEFFVLDSGAKAVICATSLSDMMFKIASINNIKIFETFDSDGVSGSFFQEFNQMELNFQDVVCSSDHDALLLYTSGTTGRSKGARITHGNLYANTKSISSEWQFDSDDVLLHMLPIFHAHGLIAVNVMFYLNASIFFVNNFNNDSFFQNLSKVSIFMGVPTYYKFLLDDSRLNLDLFANFKCFISGSAPLSKKIHYEWEKLTGHQVLERYGMTETGLLTSNPYVSSGGKKIGSVGRAFANVSVRITDILDRNVLSEGEIGAIEVITPGLCKGYLNHTDYSFLNEDGYFRTGDLGYLDEDGYLFIVGREKDMVIVGGLKVFPKEIENELDRIYGVKSNAVFGLPHPDFGECVVAVVVRNDEITEKQILNELKNRFASYKIPKKIIFVDEIPKNALGKVQKSILRLTYNETFK